jgi:hypothetical protein
MVSLTKSKKHFVGLTWALQDDKGAEMKGGFACNLMKANYDPRGYDAAAPDMLSLREHLIGIAKDCIQRDRAESESDYRLMLDQIVHR